ncbi:cytochrome c oxidase assembly protein [Couchioplanes caeruleus]|uniref:cytochrome c oxidase assembly protein n=1 Tax=Couchioplanes caeruleus TaxID=56438 RepID=UPI0020BF0DF3|nr:cytochrome c oxidase assembly protein [Couchioplanes caeruleus]UQU62557.1 cytochrome c oxidase assembly protein [Couchioplanes caeruleus]
MEPTPATSGVLSVLLLAAALGYLTGAVVVRRRGGWWPAERTISWIAGLVAAMAALVGPLADAAHHDFTAHMVGHLLLGMTAPLLLVLAAPLTLALRALPVARARTLSHLLASRPVRTLTHPVTAAVLNGGGLWLLYTTGLYGAMSDHAWIHVAVHLHVLAAGYLFTASVIGVDPAPHRPGRRTRAAVLIAFLAAHATLAKSVYGHPPAGVLPADARTGAELMYYGGDLIDLVLIYLFCRQWFQAADPARRNRPAAPRIHAVRPPRVLWRLPAEFPLEGHNARDGNRVSN